MIGHRLLLLLGLGLFGSGLSQPASAQINPFFGVRGTPFTGEDIAALTEASNRLLDRTNLVAGGIEPYTNPKSGVSGTVTAGAPLQRKGMACRKLDYDTTMPGPGPGKERLMHLTWCKTANGWKIL